MKFLDLSGLLVLSAVEAKPQGRTRVGWKKRPVRFSKPDRSFHYICCMVAMYFLFISGGEIFFIMFIVVMVFGADKIPGIAKGLGKGMRQLKDATEDIKQEIQKSADKQGIDTSFVTDIKKDIDDVKDNLTSGIGTDIKKEVDQVKKKVEDISGTVKRS